MNTKWICSTIGTFLIFLLIFFVYYKNNEKIIYQQSFEIGLIISYNLNAPDAFKRIKNINFNLISDRHIGLPLERGQSISVDLADVYYNWNEYEEMNYFLKIAEKSYDPRFIDFNLFFMAWYPQYAAKLDIHKIKISTLEYGLFEYYYLNNDLGKLNGIIKDFFDYKIAHLSPWHFFRLYQSVSLYGMRNNIHDINNRILLMTKTFKSDDNERIVSAGYGQIVVTCIQYVEYYNTLGTPEAYKCQAEWIALGKYFCQQLSNKDERSAWVPFALKQLEGRKERPLSVNE